MRAVTLIMLCLAAGCGDDLAPTVTDGGADPVADDGGGGPHGDLRARCTTDPLSSDLGHFNPVLDPAAWRFDATGYAQPVAAGAHESLVVGTATDYTRMAVTVTPTVAGDAAGPGLAGVVLFAARPPAAEADGYFCGLDLRGQRLLLGRVGGPAGAPTVTPLGWALPVAVAVGVPRAVWIEVRGPDFVSCYADGDVSDAGVQLVDSMTSSSGVPVPGGAVGLMTAGVGAAFRAATWCLP